MVFKQSSLKYRAFAIAGLLLCVFLGACKDQTQFRPEQMLIARTLLKVPEDWKYWRFYPSLAKLEFTLNVHTFENIRFTPADNNVNELHIEVRKLRSEFAEDYYWTDEDKVLKATPHSCEINNVKGKQYSFCKLGYKEGVKGNPGVWGAASVFYSIQDDAGFHTSVVGCNERDKASSLRVLCNVRALVTERVQSEYFYPASEIHRAFEIDQKVRQTITDMIIEERDHYGFASKEDYEAFFKKPVMDEQNAKK